MIAKPIAALLAAVLLTGCASTRGPAAENPAPAVTCVPRSDDDKQVMDWLSRTGLPLKSLKAGAGFDDLQPLKPILKDVRLVGMGEATHGSAEFFTMKHRLLEFLVKEMGYTVFGIEASYGAGLAVNDYVLHGTGDAKTVVQGMGFWTWSTQEVIDMVEWMRTYNQTVPPERQVRFVGFDIQLPGPAVDHLRAILKPAAPDLWEPHEKLLTDLGALSDVSFQPLHPNARDELATFITQIEQAQDRLAAASSPEQARTAVQLSHVLQRYYDAYMKGLTLVETANLRDNYMAATVAEVLNDFGPETKAALWAHNLHIATADGRMGDYLKGQFGAGYYPLGFAFKEGAFQAVGAADNRLQPHTVTPGPAGWIDWYMGCAATGPALFNFRGLKDPPQPVAVWLATEAPFRNSSTSPSPRRPRWFADARNRAPPMQEAPCRMLVMTWP